MFSAVVHIECNSIKISYLIFVYDHVPSGSKILQYDYFSVNVTEEH